MNELLYPLRFQLRISALVSDWKPIMSPVSLALAFSSHACMLVIGIGEGWGQGEVYSCSTDAGLEAALSDSVRNLFTCGGATNNCRVYIGQKERLPLQAAIQHKQSREGKYWTVLLKHNHYTCSTRPHGSHYSLRRFFFFFSIRPAGPSPFILTLAICPTLT